ncbi:hypothetical protein DFH29DRAFT_805946, partial [Suillus ampliporus]
VRRHLEPLAIAANTTQCDFACLDVVLITLVNLYHKYCDPTLNSDVCEAAWASLEKRWAKADQKTFILTVIFNPCLCVSCFAPSSPYRQFSRLWVLVHTVYQWIYDAEPNSDFRRAFQGYVRSMGEWSNESMGLHEHQEQAKRDQKNVNLVQLWFDSTTGSPPNGVSGLIHLAMHILSVVPNSAAMERVFSQFGIIHMKLRNRLSPDKVRKQALIWSDTIAQHGSLHNRKWKFVDDDNSDDECNLNSGQPTLCDTTASSLASDEVHHSHSFLPAVRELIEDVDDEVANSTDYGNDSNPDSLFLENLFHYLSPSDTESFTVTELADFWARCEHSFGVEVTFHDQLAEIQNETEPWIFIHLISHIYILLELPSASR